MLTLVIVLAGIYVLKRWFPNVYKLFKGLLIRILKVLAGWLWKKPERKGGANIRPVRMRWRQ